MLADDRSAGRPSTGRTSTRAVRLLLLAPVLALTACGGGSASSADGSTPPAAPGASSPAGDPPSSGAPSSPAGSPSGRAAPSGDPITLSFAGDVHFEGVSRAALSGGLGPITPALSAADLTMVNLETAISTRGTPVAGKQYTFRAPPSAMTALKAAGVDVVTVANNHGLDYGQAALTDTLAASKDTGLPLVGAGVDEDAAFRPYVAEVKGRKVALIGATQVLDDSVASAWTAGPGKQGLASAKDVDRLVRAVRDAREQADVVAVDLHWGSEQVGCPTSSQRSLAQTLSDAGADIVVGSHAHILLGGGWLGSTYVDYGLGNFVFYARTTPTQATGVLTLTVQGRAVTKADWAPARISGGVPLPLTGSTASSALATKQGLRGCTGLAAAP